MSLLRSFSALAALTLFGACVSVLPEQETPKALYRLGSIPAAAGLPADIVVREPMAERVLGGQAMVIEGSDGGLRLISGVEWSGRLTRLMQTGLIDALSGDGEGIAMPEITGAPGKYELSWRIKDLSLASGDRAVCALDLTIMEGRTREPVAHGTVQASLNVRSKTPAQRAQALSEVARECLSEAAYFVSSAVEEVYSPASGS